MTLDSYYRPDSLCDTSQVQENLSNQNVVILKVDNDPETAYNEGHLPNAHLVWWKKDINDAQRRDILSEQQFEELMSRVGTTSDSEQILYGDFNNWFAAFAFWVFDYYGHKKLKIMNGGRKKQEAEGKEYTKSISRPKNSSYHATPPNEGIRAYFSDVRRELESTRDGTFKELGDLKKLYIEKGVTPDKNVICYCRIGERSSHTWFVLKYLLGYASVRNYDG